MPDSDSGVVLLSCRNSVCMMNKGERARMRARPCSCSTRARGNWALIFIRNRLNADVGTGDNIKADVNLDTRINILDLIYVRNRLNNACP